MTQRSLATQTKHAFIMRVLRELTAKIGGPPSTAELTAE